MRSAIWKAGAARYRSTAWLDMVRERRGDPVPIALDPFAGRESAGGEIMFLHRDDFARAERQGFDVFVGDATVTMTLVTIEPLNTLQSQAREAFPLIFGSTSPIVLPQKIYPMRNRSLAARKVGARRR